MFQSEEGTKQVLLTAYQLLCSHEKDILRMQASLETIVKFLESRSSDFAPLHANALRPIEQQIRDLFPQSLRTISDTIESIRKS